ncbi:MAG: phosphohydrolase [Candidatus Levybacteria bacterium]|nr:phosphohydrolase [Candidatus Levybacteria bacterium]
MTRQDALQTLTGLISNPNLIKHHLACEVIMLSLCKRLNPKADSLTLNKWGTVGLLHDADYELTRDNPTQHTLVLEQRIGNLLDSDVMYAIKAHNFQKTGVEPKSQMDWAMYCCDELSGLIIAAALVHPDKKLASLTPDFVMKRYNEKGFAQGADREQIALCEQKLNIALPQFIQIALSAMQKIAPDLNL